MPKFEVGIYNQKVRDLIAEDEHHPHLDDEWADIHYFEVDAPSADEARRRMIGRFSPGAGYVIDNVEELPDME